MKLRIMATPGEAQAAAAALREVPGVAEADGARPDRGHSKLVHVYAGARLPEGGEAR